MRVAFSCKRRGFFPSCGARRMAQTAAHLVDHVAAAGELYFADRRTGDFGVHTADIV